MKNKRKEAITMSNEWKMVRLGDVCDISAGGTPSRSKREYWHEGTIPWVKIGDMNEKYLCKTTEYITELGLNSSSAKLFEKGTILFSIFASLGVVSILDIDATTNQAIAGLRIKDSRRLDKGFLYHFLVSIKKEIERIGRGVAQNNINLGVLKGYSITLPSFTKQREIAAVLDKASELVEKRKAQLAELDLLAESVFYDMFGDPVTNEKGWSHKTLSELGDWKSGGTPSRNNSGYFRGDTPWVSSGELNNMYIGGTNEHITEDAILNSNTKKIKVGAILLGMYDTAALKSSITKRIMCCNQAIAYSRLDDNVVDTLFVYTVIQICKDEYKKLQRGIRQKNLNLSMIKAISIIYPPLSLQQQFATIIEKIEEEKAKAKEALKESENLFQRLMQDMFNPEYHNL